MLLLTFFSSGSLTVSLREVSALRICAAAMLVEVFSKACIYESVSPILPFVWNYMQRKLAIASCFGTAYGFGWMW